MFYLFLLLTEQKHVQQTLFDFLVTNGSKGPWRSHAHHADGYVLPVVFLHEGNAISHSTLRVVVDFVSQQVNRSGDGLYSERETNLRSIVTASLISGDLI